MQSDVLGLISKTHLADYLRWAQRFAEIDVDAAYRAAVAVGRRHDGQSFDSGDIQVMDALEARWYASLDSGRPDYGVYGDPYYFVEVWLCWIKYSRKYLKAIAAERSLGDQSIVASMKDVHTVVDLGCGFGYTTAGIAQLFPRARVLGTNLTGTPQFEMATELGREKGFEISDSYNGIDADLVFASEYFEHFDRPLEHLYHVVTATRPRYLLIANTFTQPAIGHFNEYHHLDKSFTGRQISVLFGRMMRMGGYEKVDTNCWNSRPALWRSRK